MAKSNHILKNKTPEENYCAMGTCPAIYEFISEVTPQEMVCGVGVCPAIYEGIKELTLQGMCAAVACPSVYEYKRKIEGEDVYLIIGRKIDNPSKEGLGELEKKIGKDEVLIEVPRGLIDNLNK